MEAVIEQPLAMSINFSRQQAPMFGLMRRN